MTRPTVLPYTVMSGNDEYITAEEAGMILRVGARQAVRYADRVRTRKAGKRILLHKGDVEQLAHEIGAEHKGAVPPPAELVPVGAMMETFERQQQQLVLFSREIGRLEGTLQSQQKQLDEAEAIRRRVWELETERDRLLAEIEQLRKRLD